jgi:hypothetical protein
VDSIGLGQGPVVGSCEHTDYTLGSGTKELINRRISTYMCTKKKYENVKCKIHSDNGLPKFLLTKFLVNSNL